GVGAGEPSLAGLRLARAASAVDGAEASAEAGDSSSPSVEPVETTQADSGSTTEVVPETGGEQSSAERKPTTEDDVDPKGGSDD
ncbi:MAG: hypothetical protein ACRDQ0_09085, partial [Pseudonocardia sp.]